MAMDSAAAMMSGRRWLHTIRQPSEFTTVRVKATVTEPEEGAVQQGSTGSSWSSTDTDSEVKLNRVQLRMAKMEASQ
ncbi:unnamed protein product, partial [Symbiodinium pilosum]